MSDPSARRRFDTVTFLSDYGHADEFVGVVHSVIRSIAPQARVIDLVHDIAPHDIRAGGLALARAVQYVAPGVILAVVDPGVGTDRRAVAIEVADGAAVFVGPDNGLLASAVAMTGGAQRAVVLDRPEHRLDGAGPTFAGRDLFAPAAAHLCNGVPLDEMGSSIDPVTLLPGIMPLPRVEGEGLLTEVLWVDRYGNAQLNVGPDELAELDPSGVGVQLRCGPVVRSARRAPTYAAIPPGSVGLVVDASGLVSIAFDRRSAADELELAPGSEVILGVATDDGSARVPTPVSVAMRPPGEGGR